MTQDTCELLCLDAAKAERVRLALPSVESLEPAALEAKALSDPTRLRIAFALQAGEELCVCDLAWVTGRQEKLVSHHLRLLRSAGLARARKDGKMVLYSLTERGAGLVVDFMARAASVPP